MAGKMQNSVLIALIVVVVIFILYQYDRSLFGLLGRRYEGFVTAGVPLANAHGNEGAGQMAAPGKPTARLAKDGFAVANSTIIAQPPAFGDSARTQPEGIPGTNSNGAKKEGFADLASFEGPASFASVDAPAGCYPRDQLTPSELLPMDQTSIYAQQNPMGPGSLKGKNFLSAGALIGVNTVGQSLRNANLQLRSEPANPQVPVSIFSNSTISPDISHRPLEIGA